MDDLLGAPHHATPEEPDILMEERGVLVVNKPAGILTQAPPGIPSMEATLRRWLKHRDGKSGKIYLAVTHRLDRPVSGALVVGKNVRAAKRIQEQFRKRLVKKLYLAIVNGVAEESGTMTDWMRKIPDEAKSEIVPESHPEAKRAVLHYRRLEVVDGQSLVEINLETGRTHQIRIQFSHRGLAILGDALYGSAVEFGPQHADLRKRAIALHAREIRFEHPILHESVVAEAPLPPYWGNRFVSLAVDKAED